MKTCVFAVLLFAALPACARQPPWIEQLYRDFSRHMQDLSKEVDGASNASDFRACTQFFANGKPPDLGATTGLAPQELCYDAFAILHSGRSKTPVFVAERLNRAQLEAARNEQRTDRFFADARLPANARANLEDYRHSGYARGHMAPAADMPTDTAMAQSFSLANVVPQAPVNNQRSWAGIERATRKYAMRAQGNVYVITGPVFGSQPKRIGPGKVWVPTHLYKLVYDETTRRAWAYWIANTDEARAARPITYGELVRRTGITFLPGLSPRD